MINPSLPQLEGTTLAQYFGLDVEALRDHLDWLSECAMGDREMEAEIEKAERAKRQYRNMQHNAQLRGWGWIE